MAYCSFLVQEFLKAVERPGVDHIVWGEPAPLSCGDPEAEVREVPGGVGVAVDGEDGSVPEGRPDQARGEVQAIGEGVDLERGAGAGAGGEHGVPVGVDGCAPADEPRAGVADNVDVRRSEPA
jgi:hypothetical protein